MDLNSRLFEIDPQISFRLAEGLAEADKEINIIKANLQRNKNLSWRQEDSMIKSKQKELYERVLRSVADDLKDS